MPTKRVRVIVNGLPFALDVDDTVSNEQAAQALSEQLQQDPSIFTRRREQLGLSEADLAAIQAQERGEDPGVRIEPMSTFEELLVGAGRSFTTAIRGGRQLFNRATGDEEELAQLQAIESDERELFRALDEQGIGAEDIGQLVPDLVAFLGSGGLLSLAARGAVLGGVQATGEDEGLGDRSLNALVSGTLSAAGPLAARAVRAPFRAGTRLAASAFSAARGLATRTGGFSASLGRTVVDSARAQASTNPAIQKLGRAGFDKASQLIQQMNARGKRGVAGEAANAALQKSIRQVNGQNVVDFAAFNEQLAHLGRSELNRRLGKTFGARLDDLRNTFDEIATLDVLSPTQAQAVLSNLMTNAEARSLATALRRSSTDTAKRAALRRLVAVSTEQAEEPLGRVGEALFNEQ